MLYIIALGSNLGNPRLNIARAVKKIAYEFGNFELSHVISSRPQGFRSDRTFLNAVMLVHSDLEPIDMLHALQAIEREISPKPHRNARGEYIDREIDIDLIAAEENIVDTPELQLPHPRMAERVFVLQPLAEIAGAWRHPVTGLTAIQMLDRLTSMPDESTGL